MVARGSLLVYNRRVKFAAILAIGVLILAACGGSDPTRTPAPTPEPTVPAVTVSATKATINTNMGAIVLELFPGQAPKTVENFVTLSGQGFYEGVIFHRVIPGFMIQGGDPTGTGSGGPGHSFEDEFDASLVFDSAGILAMANSGPNTNGSQFFITLAPTTHLNGRHTIFGRVLAGQEVADAISEVPRNERDKPLDPVVISSIEIE